MDYVAVSRTVVLTSSISRSCVNVMILDDFDVEDRESFRLELSTSTPSVIVTVPSATVFIDDNDEGTITYTTLLDT